MTEVKIQTREEQIQEASEKAVDKVLIDQEGYHNGFIDGAKWADNHIDLRKLDHITEQLKNHQSSVDYYSKERKDLMAKVEKYDSDRRIFLTALMRIASFQEGPVVNSTFDEPASAKIAREAMLQVEI